MKKILSMALAALLLVGTLGGCSTSGWENGKLVLYTWENMFPQEVLDGFTQETGISVTYSNFDTDETMLARLEAAEGGDYDLVIADDYIIETAIQEGLVQELDTSKLENYGSINPVYQGQFYDPENKYTVPYGAGVQTIVYDPSAVDVEIKGYADLWDASLEDNLGIIDNFRVVNGMALKVLGESYNTEDTAAIEAAGDKLLELAPNIRLIKDQNTQDDLLSGEVGAAVLYTSQATMAKWSSPKRALALALWPSSSPPTPPTRRTPTSSSITSSSRRWPPSALSTSATTAPTWTPRSTSPRNTGTSSPCPRTSTPAPWR